jgi:predicted transcriptional regulator
MKESLIISIDTNLKKELQHIAIDINSNITNIVNELIKEFIAKHKSEVNK